LYIVFLNYCQSMEWRASANIDECNEWPIAKEVQKEFWYGYAGKDKHGQAGNVYILFY